MTQSPLSINTKPFYVKNWPGCRTFLRQLNPTTAVVAIDQHDHFNYILEAKADLPNAKIVARFIDKDHDGNMHEKPKTTSDKYIVSPVNQLNRIKRYGKDGLTAYFGNEPSTKADPDDLKRLSDHTCEAMDLAASRDYDMSLTVLNLGIGHPKPIDGFLPVWMHPILMKLDEHRNRHFYGLHAYLPLDTLEHLNALKRTCLERLQIPVPRCIITEWGYDSDGTGGRDGFKARGISNEVFALRCVKACEVDFRQWIESGDLLGLCTFIYGDDASWFSFNVETSNKPGEVSTAWRDTIIKAKLAGELDIMLVRNVLPGTMYRVSLPGGITSVYKTPDLSTRLSGKTIPDQAVVRAFSPVYIKPETWLPVEYPTIEGRVWIPMKDGAVKLQTMEMPIFVDDTPTKPLPNAPQSPPALEPGVNPVVLPETHQNGSNAQNNAIVAQLKVIAGAINALITLLENETDPIKV